MDVDAVFAALADPTRRRLVDQLAAEGPLTATQLAQHYPVSRQAVVKHLGALSAAGLLHSHREGREVRYDLVPGPLQGATAWMSEVGFRWDQRLDALEQQLRRDGD
jgi:DNA-binding transcriptional ArsR family regulator